jgi:hypothetical protein
LIDRQAESFARQVPERDLDATQGRHELAALSAGKDAARADALENGIDVKRVLADQTRLLHHVGGSYSFQEGCSFENGLVTRFLSACAELEIRSA